jgi:hypothetical protein
VIRDRFASWGLGQRSPRSRVSLDLERGTDGLPFLIVSHEIRASGSEPWHRRRGVALSLAEGRELRLALAESETYLRERKRSA